MIAEIIAALVLLLLIGAFLIRSAYERRHPVLTEYTVFLKDLPRSFSGVRIAYLTDLHGTNPGKLQERTVKLLENLHADYVLMGGDMLTVHRGRRFQPEPVLELVKASPSAFPVIYADGNHETRMEEKRQEYPGWADKFDALLHAAGVVRLRNSRVILERDGEKIAVGSAELPRSTYLKKWSKMPLPDGVFEKALGKKQEACEILLLHSPQYLKEAADYGADLTLAGHFHGGTVRLPFAGGVMTPQFQFFSRYTRGLFRFGNRYGIVSGGLGTHSVNIRFMNRPEIVAVTLKREEET